MTIASSKHGKALEYILVATIIKLMPKGMTRLTNQAADFQKRDKSDFQWLEPELRTRFLKQAKQIYSWLDIEFGISEHKLLLHRLSDHEARQGDVADLCISFNDEQISLSLKNNHHALKHQRPPSAAQWMGLSKGEEKDATYREEINSIFNNFVTYAKNIKSDATKFNEIKAIEGNSIENMLYKPMCDCIASFLKKECANEASVRNLFTFLVSKDYYKLICKKNDIQIYKFFDIEIPHSVTISRRESNYIDLSFSNGWLIEMRIHTASSSIKLSLKFDTHLSNADDVLNHFNI